MAGIERFALWRDQKKYSGFDQAAPGAPGRYEVRAVDDLGGVATRWMEVTLAQ